MPEMTFEAGSISRRSSRSKKHPKNEGLGYLRATGSESLESLADCQFKPGLHERPLAEIVDQVAARL